MSNDKNTAHLWFAGKPATAHSLIAPVEPSQLAEGTASGAFVLEYRRDSENLVMLLTQGGSDGLSKPVMVSVSFPVALVRDLLDRVPEAPHDVAQGLGGPPAPKSADRVLALMADIYAKVLDGRLVPVDQSAAEELAAIQERAAQRDAAN